VPTYSFGELTTEITATENKIYEMIDKGDPSSLNEAKGLVHELAETLRGILKDTDALASRTPRHSRINMSNTNGPVQVGNGCVQTNQF
jgi:hypothetical protein